MQIKILDNSTVLHMFNNYTYTGFGVAYKHALIASYLCDLTEPKCHKTKH